MTPLLITLIGSTGMSALVLALIKFIDNWKTRRSTRPKTEAEAIDIGIGAQGRALANLGKENERLGRRADAADLKVEAVEKKSDEREQRMQEMLDMARTEFETRIREAQAAFDQKLGQMHQENIVFKQKVETLLIEHDIALPNWWRDAL